VRGTIRFSLKPASERSGLPPDSQRFSDRAGGPDGPRTIAGRICEDRAFRGTGTLETVLTDVLGPINLAYEVKDGCLAIDSRQGTVESRLSRVEDKLDRILKALEKQTPPPR